MILISMLLVIVGFVTLLLGVLDVAVGDVEPLTFVYVSIGACLLAAVFLVIGVLHSRPSHKPAIVSGGEGQQASWSGASWPREVAPAPEPAAERERGPGAGAAEGAAERERGPVAGAAEGAAAVELVSTAEADAAEPGSSDELQEWAARPPADEGATDAEGRLTGIPGVGPAKRKALVDHFGSPDAVASASPEQLAEVKGISATLASRIYERLRA